MLVFLTPEEVRRTLKMPPPVLLTGKIRRVLPARSDPVRIAQLRRCVPLAARDGGYRRSVPPSRHVLGSRQLGSASAHLGQGVVAGFRRRTTRPLGIVSVTM